jgi:hypothetical protein
LASMPFYRRDLKMRLMASPPTDLAIILEQKSMDRERARSERAAKFARLVYFVQATSGAIKIGLATDVKRRLATLQTSHPEKLSLLATRLGGRVRERAYHAKFAEHRLHGEWFAPHPDILAEIERLQA